MNPPQVYTCSPSRTPLPPPFPYHPSGSSQCTSPKQPVSCIEPALATRFIHDILHLFKFPLEIPSSPSERLLELFTFVHVIAKLLYLDLSSKSITDSCFQYQRLKGDQWKAHTVLSYSLQFSSQEDEEKTSSWCRTLSP